MSDVDEIIDYIKQLKKGFDKELFQSKIDELAYIVETTGLDGEEFYTLFKIWLNLSIPITKWASLGACLVPQGRVDERSVDYAFRWLLSNWDSPTNYPRMAFLLDWLTAAMDSNSVDMTALDSGYEIFYAMLSSEVLTVHALKLVYTLSKPRDVTRKRVLELLDLAKMREGKKNMYRQIQVLLGLFKSYKPECVPETIPAISVHTSFKKINFNLVERFRKRQEQRNGTLQERQRLMWGNPLHADGRNKKAEPLVPNLELINMGSQQNTENESQKTLVDFSEPVSLIQCAINDDTWRPARLRALLSNSAGLALLAASAPHHRAFLSHDLHHLLVSCFLSSSPHSYTEKADLLQRLAVLQRTLLQGIPVITRFLAQYLPFWNEHDYFAEILSLVERAAPESAAQAAGVVEPLGRCYQRAAPARQCAILRALTTMYCNLVYSSRGSGGGREEVLAAVARALADMCQRQLQANPEDLRVLHSSLSSALRRARCEARCGGGGGSVAAAPGALALAVPLLLPCALAMDDVAGLLMMYRKILSQNKSTNADKDTYIALRKTLERYMTDFLSCLYHERVLAERKSGLIFTDLHPQLVSKLTHLVPDVDSTFSIRNNLAFLVPIEGFDPPEVTSKMLFETIVNNHFPRLGRFLAKAVPDLNC